MKTFRPELIRNISRAIKSEGLQPTAVAGVSIIRYTAPQPRRRGRWSASVSLIAQGGKELLLGEKTYRFKAAEFIATPLDLPLANRIFAASSAQPFLGLKIDFDPVVMSELESHFRDEPSKDESALPGVIGGPASAAMLDAFLRLTRLFATPQDAPALGPLAIKEVFYHLLKSPEGPAVRQFVRAGSTMQQISRAVIQLREDLAMAVDVEELARSANMSRSTFFKHFRAVTAVSPIQYQKRLRLFEARRLMMEQGETAEAAAFKVGYNSASQFSREYSRLFGHAPSREMRRLKKTGRALLAE